MATPYPVSGIRIDIKAEVKLACLARNALGQHFWAGDGVAGEEAALSLAGRLYETDYVEEEVGWRIASG